MGTRRATGCGLLAGKAERFGMGPAVMLGQRLAESAGPVGHGALADLAARYRKLGDGDRETTGDELLIWFYDASPARVILPSAYAERATRGGRVQPRRALQDDLLRSSIGYYGSDETDHTANIVRRRLVA